MIPAARNLEAPQCATCPIHSAGYLKKLGVDMQKWDYVVALAGNPNTGKSTVFNGLTGLRQHTGEFGPDGVFDLVGSDPPGDGPVASLGSVGFVALAAVVALALSAGTDPACPTPTGDPARQRVRLATALGAVTLGSLFQDAGEGDELVFGEDLRGPYRYPRKGAVAGQPWVPQDES